MSTPRTNEHTHHAGGGPRWAIRGTGSYLPDRTVSSEELSRDLGLAPEWIEQRTGIRRRHVAAPGQAASDLALAAAERALHAAGARPADLGLIVVGTATPDELGPPTACRVQARLGARRAAAFDVAAACTGFVFGLQAAVGWLATQRGSAPLALVIGVEVFSKFLNPADRATAALVGDGAAAAVVGPVPAPYGITSLALGADGTGAEAAIIPAGGSRTPPSAATLADGGHTIHMDAAAVRTFIVDIFPRPVAEATDAAGDQARRPGPGRPAPAQPQAGGVLGAPRRPGPRAARHRRAGCRQHRRRQPPLRPGPRRAHPRHRPRRTGPAGGVRRRPHLGPRTDQLAAVLSPAPATGPVTGPRRHSAAARGPTGQTGTTAASSARARPRSRAGPRRFGAVRQRAPWPRRAPRVDGERRLVPAPRPGDRERGARFVDVDEHRPAVRGERHP
ncbi:UNVERIFIED_ORG: 3-oxoacyl-(acyl-carrier-protein) synthase III, partial [Actinomadura viridilutea]